MSEEIWFRDVCFILEIQLLCQLTMIRITRYLIYYAKCGARSFFFYCGAATFSGRLRLTAITNVAYQIKYACSCHFIHQ